MTCIIPLYQLSSRQYCHLTGRTAGRSKKISSPYREWIPPLRVEMSRKYLQVRGNESMKNILNWFMTEDMKIPFPSPDIYDQSYSLPVLNYEQSYSSSMQIYEQGVQLFQFQQLFRNPCFWPLFRPLLGHFALKFPFKSLWSLLEALCLSLQ